MKKILGTILFTFFVIPQQAQAIDNIDIGSTRNPFGSSGSLGDLLGSTGNTISTGAAAGLSIFGNNASNGEFPGSSNPGVINQPTITTNMPPAVYNIFATTNAISANVTSAPTSYSPSSTLNTRISSTPRMSISCGMNSSGIFVCEPKRRNSIDPTAPPDSDIGATITSFGNIGPPSNTNGGSSGANR